MADEIKSHVGYSPENACHFVRFYPFTTHEEAEAFIARTKELENQNTMLRAAAEGAGSLLLDVQKECIAAVERIEHLKAALEPFSKAADEADAMVAEHERLGMGRLTDNATTGLGVKLGHLRHARKILNGEPRDG